MVSADAIPPGSLSPPAAASFESAASAGSEKQVRFALSVRDILQHRRRQLSGVLRTEGWEIVMGVVVLAHFVFVAVETDRRYKPAGDVALRAIYFERDFVTLLLVNAGFTAVYLLELALWHVADARYFWHQRHYQFNAAMCLLSLGTDGLGLLALRTQETTARDILQSFGVLRIFRVIYAFGRVQGAIIVVRGFLFSFIALVKVMAVLSIVVYLFANIGYRFFAQGVLNDELVPEMAFRWGNLSSSLFSLFLMLTFDGWSDLSLDTQDVYRASPSFFVLFIASTGIVLLSVVTSAMVQAFLEASRAMRTDERYRNEIKKERQAVKSLKDLIDLAAKTASRAIFEGDFSFSSTSRSAGSNCRAPARRRSLGGDATERTADPSVVKPAASAPPGRLDLSSGCPEEVVARMAPLLDAVDISPFTAAGVVELFRRFDVKDATAEDLASALAAVAAGEGSSRQLLVAQVEFQRLQDRMEAKIKDLELQAKETDALVTELKLRLAASKFRRLSSLEAPPPARLRIRTIRSMLRSDSVRSSAYRLRPYLWRASSRRRRLQRSSPSSSLSSSVSSATAPPVADGTPFNGDLDLR